MKLAEFKGDKAFEVAANLMMPIAAIVKSDVFKRATVSNKLELARLLLLADTDAIKEILAILADVSPREYVCTGKTILQGVLEAVSDKDFVALFISPRQKTEEKLSCTVSENANAEI